MTEQGARLTRDAMVERLFAGRAALVLGAGGPVGHAFHAGILAGLRDALGWDARAADLVVGTSAGSQVAVLLRAGVPPMDLLARVLNRPLSDESAAVAAHFIRPDMPRRPKWWGWPSSPALLGRALLAPWRHGLGSWIAAMLPSGAVDLRLQAEGIRRMFDRPWPIAETWIPALNLDTGAVTTFGRDAFGALDIGSAVAASCAVPGICRPVVVGAQRFVDGGVACSHHLDVLPDEHEVLVVSSPLSALPWVRRRIANRVARWRRRGGVALVFEPDSRLREAIRLDFLNPARAPEVARLAYASVRSQWDHPGP